MDEKIVATLRVKSCVIKRSTYVDGNLGQTTGEILEVKAEGLWNPSESEKAVFKTDYPVSLHVAIYPGCGAIPMIGDNIKITVERLRE